MKVVSEALISQLCHSDVKAEQAIFLIFDEARPLTLCNCDGKEPHKSNAKISQFQLLRRSLRKMGKADIRIFTILTDASSELTQIHLFQTKNDHNTTRNLIRAPRIGNMFAPLCVMPTIDLNARYLQATCDPKVVQNVDRLIKFGRVGFGVMRKETSADWMLPFAISKLMRIDSKKINIDSMSFALCALYAPGAEKTTEHLDRKFLACLGVRLALQVGSFSEDARELVAGHMMYVEHVGADPQQLFTRYLSEPILTKASVRLTGENSWELPLDYLLSKIQHRVVDGGIRGEFVTEALLCIACEDAQRASRIAGEKKRVERKLKTAGAEPDRDESIVNTGSWKYSTPVTVRQFLNSLFRQPGKPLKRKLPEASDASQKVKAETETAKDDVPPADDSFTTQFLFPTLKSKFSKTHHIPEDKISSFLDGTIFFNHWIRTQEILRPLVLVKAWNRNAALMCKDGGIGVDFVIPVMRKWSQEIKDAETRLGKCTQAKWTDDQQAAASEVISYILIQTKNRTSSTTSDRLDEMVKAVPLDNHLNTRPNFLQHEPQHPFVSILFDFHVKPPQRDPAELLWTVSDREYAHKAATGKAASLKEVAAAEKDPDKKVEAAKEAKKALDDVKIAQTRINIAKYQIPIVSFGLDGTAFKCLETRPRLAVKLNQLLTVVDPLDKLEGPLRMELLESRVCISGEGELGDEMPEAE
jgi:hypothetical protein